MIKINNGVPAFIATGADTMTSTKTALLTVNYQTSLGTKEVDGKSVPQGFIGSWCMNESGTNIMGVQKIEEDTDPKFVGKNAAEVMKVLTNDYVAELKALNPKVTIESTLK